MTTQRELLSILVNTVACGAALAGSAQLGSAALAGSSLHWLLHVLVQTQDINGRSDGAPLQATQQRLWGVLDVVVIAGCAAYFMAIFRVAHGIAHVESDKAHLMLLWSLPGAVATALFINERKQGGTDDDYRLADSHWALGCAAVPGFAALLILATSWGPIDWMATALLLAIGVWRAGRFLKVLLR